MAENFYCILTDKGCALDAAAKAGEAPLDFAEFAVGDAGGAYAEPQSTQVNLVNEVARVPVNSVYVHPNNADWLVIEAIIPAASGGFEIREAGVWNAAGDLLAVGKYPLTSKPLPGSGSEKDLYVRMILQITNAAYVTQQIDPSLVLATKEYVDTRDWRESVRAATTAPVADLAAGAPDHLDGVALAAGDRVLAKDQDGGSDNGIYVVQTVGAGADGAWVRSADADNALDISANVTVAIEEGTVNGDSRWMLTADHPIVLGTTPLTFERLPRQADLDAHAGRNDNPHGVTAAQAGADVAGTAVARVSDHEAAEDPHPQYETSAEAQAKIEAAVAALVDSSPETLDTLNELAAALGDDPDFATTMVNALAAKETPAGAQAKVDAHAAATDPHPQYKTPAGTVIYYAAATAPVGYLKCNGDAVSRTIYAALFAAIGTTFGDGDGSTTFNLPDLRGEFVRGWDDGRGVDVGREQGSSQDGLLEDHRHHSVPAEQDQSYTWGGPGGGGPADGNNSTAVHTTGDVSTADVAGAETRPRNVALLACIKY